RGEPDVWQPRWAHRATWRVWDTRDGLHDDSSRRAAQGEPGFPDHEPARCAHVAVLLGSTEARIAAAGRAYRGDRAAGRDNRRDVAGARADPVANQSDPDRGRAASPRAVDARSRIRQPVQDPCRVSLDDAARS